MCRTWDLNLRSLKMNMYYRKREWHYKNISPLILAEHYVDLYREALLHKDFKDRAFLSRSNLSDNLGMRSAYFCKFI